jgi:uncharacterized membrane protein
MMRPVNPDPLPSPPPHLANVTRAVAVASLVGLIVLGLAWELWLAPTGGRTLALKVLPLVIPLPGLLKRRMYTYRWVSLMVWLYFIEGTVRATSGSGPSVPLAWIEVLLCVSLFAACAVHVRWRLKQAKLRGQTDAPNPTGPENPPA